MTHSRNILWLPILFWILLIPISIGTFAIGFKAGQTMTADNEFPGAQKEVTIFIDYLYNWTLTVYSPRTSAITSYYANASNFASAVVYGQGDTTYRCDLPIPILYASVASNEGEINDTMKVSVMYGGCEVDSGFGQMSYARHVGVSLRYNFSALGYSPKVVPVNLVKNRELRILNGHGVWLVEATDGRGYSTLSLKVDDMDKSFVFSGDVLSMLIYNRGGGKSMTVQVLEDGKVVDEAEFSGAVGRHSYFFKGSWIQEV